MFSISKEQVKGCQEKVLQFYKKQGRDLPWRKTTDPYHILVSEIMLQQTQVDRVIPKFESWIKKWPTPQALAQASRAEVLEAWMGLGYNNRALRLQQTAQIISERYQCNLIKALQEEKLPGIGPYTKHAVLIFSQNHDEVTVDTNIRRIFIHEFNLPESLTEKELQDIAEQCLPKGKSRDWHNALMDYGATFLTSRKTGIKPLTQQSKFEGSDRQLRARLLRWFLSHKEESFSPKDLHERLLIEETRAQSVLNTLLKDDLISKKEGEYQLKN